MSSEIGDVTAINSILGLSWVKRLVSLRNTRTLQGVFLRRVHGRFVELDTFRENHRCDVVMVPRNIALIGRQAGDRRWDVSVSASNNLGRRLYGFIRFWSRFVQPLLGEESVWLQLCYWDAWRERVEFSESYEWVPVGKSEVLAAEWRGGPGQLPIFSESRPWVAAFGAQRGDPSVLLVPEAHYLRFYYLPHRARLAAEQTRWDVKVNRAIFAGKDHGEPSPNAVGIANAHPRRTLANVVERDSLDVDVYFQGGITRRCQISYKYLIDVDGFVRTWDAWWWKLMSGSVVLSQTSTWETFFTRQFHPWEHFIPLAADLSDLGSQLEWCQSHDDQCRAIARRARQRALEVYHPKRAAEIVATNFRSLRFNTS